jgi:predicted kinase
VKKAAPERKNPVSNLLVFLIGRPGSGKSTFARYLTRALISTDVLYLNDYQLLLTQAKKLSPDQIKWEPNGQFEILDRPIFDNLFTELVKPIGSNRGRRPIIVEFSRSSYVSAFATLNDLANSSFVIVYLDSPIEVCIHRNAVRTPESPINSTPEAVIRKHLAEDDLSALLKTYPGRIRVIQNVGSSLHNLDREASLLLEEVVGAEHVKTLRPARHLEKELAVVGLLAFYLFAFLAMCTLTWRAGQSSFLASFAPDSDPGRLPFLKTMIYTCAAGGLGSTTYCIRALYHYYIKGSFDFDRFKWWYLFRPLTGSVLAISSFAIVQGGVVALGATGAGHVPSANLAWFGVAYLAGFGTEQVIEWLRRASKSLFGESRVQPDDTGHN